MIGVGHIGANGLKWSARREQTLHFCKDYFMIYDFVKANHHSSDPEWGGEPLEEFFAEPIDIFGF